jgi:hypothetical protein
VSVDLYLVIEPMESSSKVKDHRKMMMEKRNTLKVAPIMRKATLPMENKIERGRLRKKSACLEPFFDKELADSQSENESDALETSVFNDMYVMGEKIGEGAHGVVKKCFCKQTG